MKEDIEKDGDENGGEGKSVETMGYIRGRG